MSQGNNFNFNDAPLQRELTDDEYATVKLRTGRVLSLLFPDQPLRLVGRWYRVGIGAGLAVHVVSGGWVDFRDNHSGRGCILDLIAREIGGNLRAAERWIRAHDFLKCVEPGIAEQLPKRVRKIEERETTERIALARSIYEASIPIIGTTAELYLRYERGIAIELPQRLRFVAREHHAKAPPEGAMIAPMHLATGELRAVQLTFLRPDGSSRRDPITRKRIKITYGPRGACAVRLAPIAETFALAEGIETALSFTQLTGIRCWAICGSDFLNAEVPHGVENLIIAADRDPMTGGSNAAFAFKSTRSAAFPPYSIDVRLPDDGHKDFNDQLLGGMR